VGIEVLANITVYIAVTVSTVDNFSIYCIKGLGLTNACIVLQVVPGFSKGASTGTEFTRARHKANSKAGAPLTRPTETSVGLVDSTSVFSRR